MKRFLKKFFDRSLSVYSQSDLDRQLKAKFFLALYLVILAVLIALTIISGLIQYQFTEYGFKGITSILLASFACIFIVLLLLMRGYFLLSTHLLIIIIMITDWIVVIVDPSGTVARLDSFVYVISLLGLLPLVINKRKSVIFLYGAINIGFLFEFIHFFRTELSIPDYAVVDYLCDNSLAIIAACFIAAGVFAINETAIKRAKAEIEERKQAEEIRIKLEAQLHQAQKMEAIGQLAGGVAHDFNNMLSVVIGNTELVMMQPHLDNQAMEQLTAIRSTVTRSARLVRQLLAFARKQTVVPEVLDINQTVSDMLPMLYQLIGENITIEWQPGEKIGHIMIDPSQMDQILTNLLVNARDAIGKVGRVIIETRGILLDKPRLEFGQNEVRPGPYTLLIVSDNGCGMDKETREQIFEPFFSTKKRMGTGLGLATVYGIVRQNKGYITVQSEPGRGTTFSIYFPVIETRDIPGEPETASGALEEGSETILMVEDDQAILKFGATVLEQLGYTVIAVEDPVKALDLVRSGGRNPIDLLLTDVIMPRMNGRELMQKIRAIIPDVRCLYISGYTADVIGNEELAEKGTRFLAKPFSIRELAEKVREALS